MKKGIILNIFIVLMAMTGGYAWEYNSSSLHSSIDIHGFASQGYLYSTENNYFDETSDGTFNFREYGINIGNNLTDSLRVGAQIYGRSLGDMGEDKIQLDWAQADYSWKDWLGVRIGKIKFAHGIYGNIRDIDGIRGNILLPQSVYRDRNRDINTHVVGGGLYGNISLASAGSLNYLFAYGSIDIPDDSGLNGLFESYGLYTIDSWDFYNKVLIYDLKWETPLEGFSLKISIGDGSDVDSQGKTTSLLRSRGVPAGYPLEVHYTDYDTIYSMEYKFNNWSFVAEYQRTEVEVEIPLIRYTSNLNPEGWYFMASYGFLEKFQVGAGYMEYYYNKDDHSGKNLVRQGQPDFRAWQKEIILFQRYDITSNLIFKLEEHFINGVGVMLTQENPEGWEEDSVLYATKLSYTF